MQETVIRNIAQHLQAYWNLARRYVPSMNEAMNDHTDAIDSMVKNYMPSGSGIDSGVQYEHELSSPNKIVMSFGYHHMKDGMYTHWTYHKIIITPSLANGFDMRITGPNYNDIKDYLYDTFYTALTHDVERGE